MRAGTSAIGFHCANPNFFVLVDAASEESGGWLAESLQHVLFYERSSQRGWAPRATSARSVATKLNRKAALAGEGLGSMEEL